MSNVKNNSDKNEFSTKTKSEAILFTSDFKAVVNTPAGRRFLWRLLAECGVHHSSFSIADQQMAYREGRRSIGLFVQSLFMQTPDLYLLMLKEGINMHGSPTESPSWQCMQQEDNDAEKFAYLHEN